MLNLRRILTLGTVLAMSCTPQIDASTIPDLYLRDSLTLNGQWNTIIDPYEIGFYDYRWRQRDLSEHPDPSETFYLDQPPSDPSARVEYDFDHSETLVVPSDWNTQRDELMYYEGTLWYRKVFDMDSIAEGGRVFVRFGAANYRADVYLNGKRLGTHIGGFTPFSFEASDQIQEGENSLVVRVDNTRSSDGVPTLNTDWWNYGGLTREVRIVTTPANFISEHRVMLDSESLNASDRVISGWVQLDQPIAGEQIQVSIQELGIKAHAITDESGRASFRMVSEDLELWSPESPVLYGVSMTHNNDTIEDQIGFRTISTQGKQLLLNGEPVFLRGISIHDERPIGKHGRTRSPGDSKKLLEYAKDLGCNYVRLAHYPHPEYMTELADQMGLLVWSEVPVYWTIDWENESTYENAENQLSEMIRRDANRASIIIWSLANETPVGEARTRFLKQLAATARNLDPTRLLSLALEKHSKPGDPSVNIVQDPIADVVDVVSFNQYIGWYDGLPEKCGRVSWEIPYDMPVIISEFGAGAKAGFHGDASERWTEEYQEDLYIQTLSMLDTIDGLAGLSPWILTDFRSPRRVLPKIQDGYNRKGLISDDGIKKKAFGVLQEYYRERALD